MKINIKKYNNFYLAIRSWRNLRDIYEPGYSAGIKMECFLWRIGANAGGWEMEYPLEYSGKTLAGDFRHPVTEAFL